MLLQKQKLVKVELILTLKHSDFIYDTSAFYKYMTYIFAGIDSYN